MWYLLLCSHHSEIRSEYCMFTIYQTMWALELEHHAEVANLGNVVDILIICLYDKQIKIESSPFHSWLSFGQFFFCIVKSFATKFE